MDFFGVVNARRSVRKFDGEPVGRCVVERIVAGVVTTLAFLSGCAHPEAVWRYRPARALVYEEALGSELVVVAHYADAPPPNRQTGRFAFRVDRVLKGSAVHSGQIIQVAVGDPYYIAPPRRGDHWGWPVFPMDRDEPAGIALYYADPGWPRVLRSPSPVVVDLREPRLYFFPKRHEPQLRVWGQVGHTWQVDAWDKAVAGDDPGVVFRVMHPLSSEARQQGFDALYVGRGPGAIRELIELVAAPPPGAFCLNASEVLVGIGDQNGDVYAPGLKRLEGVKEDEDADALSLAKLLARLDGERALKDFARILGRRDRYPRRLAGALAGALGYVPTHRSLGMLISLAEDSDKRVAGNAFNGLHTALYGPFGTPSPRNLRLREHARPLLRDVLTDERLREIDAPFHMFRFMWALYPARYRPRRWSMEQLESKLLRPSGGYEAETSGACGFIRQASDPKYVPLLVKAFKTRRELRTEYAPHFREAFGHYLFIHRNAMLREIKAQNAIGLYYHPKRFGGYAVWALRADHPDQGPASLRELEAFRRWHVNPERYVQAQHRSGVVRQLEAAVRRGTDTLDGPDVQHIRWLSLLAKRLDPSARDALVARWRQWRSQVRINLLSLAVRHGRSDLVGPLIAEVRITLRCVGHPEWPKTGWHTEPLLTADHPKAQRECLRLLDALDRAGDARPHVSPNYRMEYRVMLDELYPEHRSEWARRVRALLGSARLSDRRCGVAILVRMGLVSAEEAAAMKRPDSRARTVAKLRGIVDALVKRSEEAVFLEILRGRGFDLPTAAGPDALRGLVAPLLAYESATAKAACSLIVRITGNPEFTSFLEYSPPDRRKHLAAYAKDRGLAWLRQAIG